MIAGAYSKSVFNFVRNHQTVIQSSCMYHLAFLPAANEISYCSISLPVVSVVIVPDFVHCNTYVEVSDRHFNLHFLENILYGAYIIF